jgi:hypothetical protein
LPIITTTTTMADSTTTTITLQVGHRQMHAKINQKTWSGTDDLGDLPLKDKRWLFPQGQSGRVVKFNTHLHRVPRKRISGIIPPLHHRPSRRKQALHLSHQSCSPQKPGHFKSFPKFL